MKNKNISRRKFLGSTAAAVSAFTIVPRHVLGGAGYTPPSEKLNIAGVLLQAKFPRLIFRLIFFSDF